MRRLGYRLVIRNIEHSASARTGEKLVLNTAWENVGVAQPYRDYRVAVRLKNRREQTAKPIVLVNDESIRGWLPGKHESQLSFTIPISVAMGEYDIAIGVVDETQASAIRLAIAGRDAGGWYPLSRLEITSAK